MITWQNLFLNARFYWLLMGVIGLFVLGTFSTVFFTLGLVSLAAFVVLVVLDLVQLYGREKNVTTMRVVGDRLSNGDHNPIQIVVTNKYQIPLRIRLIDELPVQFQRRDLDWRFAVEPGDSATVQYTVRPVRRGAYVFGALHAFASTRFGLIARRFSTAANIKVKVYPSYLQLKRYAFMAFDKRLQDSGLKRIRKLGHTMEFEQIKEYVPGDDTRALNWKATARSMKPMVNQYQDERAQPVYLVIDKGRLMRMPFDEMTLLDYAINASLVMSYIAIRKSDKAGIVTFAERFGDIVKAGRRNNQMYLILETLYNQQTEFLEADFERLYVGILRNVRQRSLLILMTNFESLSGLNRQMPYLKRLSEHHILVVVFFRNTEIATMTEEPAASVREIYHQTLAEKMEYEKNAMVRRLRQYGIYAVLTTPANLTVDTINQYLELKARGLV